MKREERKPTTIFISYALADRDIAQLLAKTLGLHGYTVWIDVQGIQGGTNWLEEIERGVESSDIFIVLLSSASTKSKWVMYEVSLAIAQRKRIIPIRLDQSEVPLALLSIQYLDTSDSGILAPAQLDRLLAAIKHKNGQEQKVPLDKEQLSPEKVLKDLAATDRVFIAYSRIQRPLARALSDWLNDHGKPNFYDAKLRAGVVWRQKIQKALDDATHMIIIWTPDSQKSNEVDREVSYALAEGKIIIPLLSPEIPKLPYHLHGLQYVVLKDRISDIEQDLLDAFERFSEDEDLWR